MNGDKVADIVETMPSKVSSMAEASTVAQRQSVHDYLAGLDAAEKKKYSPWEYVQCFLFNFTQNLHIYGANRCVLEWLFVEDDKRAEFSKMCVDFGIEMGLDEEYAKLAIIPPTEETDEETEVVEGLYIRASSVRFGI